MPGVKAKRLESGNLLVPLRAEAEDGLVGDGMVEVAPGDPEYERWAPYVGEEPSASSSQSTNSSS